MGWETRRGQRYYYRKVRVGGRVVSQYVGTGPLVDLLIEHEAAQPVEKPPPELVELDRAIGANWRAIQTVLTTTMLLSGYHQHKRQWRKRRKTSNPQPQPSTSSDS